MKTFAALFFVLLLVILINVHREYGTEGVRMWFGAKFANKSYERPRRRARVRTRKEAHAG